MIKKFEFEFEDRSSSNEISFEYDNEIEEKMSIVLENDIPVIYANRQALLFLAKALIKIALGEYSTASLRRAGLTMFGGIIVSLRRAGMA